MSLVLKELSPDSIKEKLLNFNEQQILECPTLLNSDSANCSSSLFSLLTETSLKRLSVYSKLLYQFNQKTDLIAPCSPSDLVFRHLFDSIKALEFLLSFLSTSLRENYYYNDISTSLSPISRQFIDVGSGAGLPGFVWASCLDTCDFILVEPREKRSVFLKEVLFSLKKEDVPLANVQIIRSRFQADAFSHEQRSQESIITCRALGGRDSFLKNSKDIFNNKKVVVELLGSSAAEAETELRKETLSFNFSSFKLFPYSNSHKSGHRYLGLSEI